MIDDPDEFISLKAAAEHAKTCRQAIFLAIRKKKLKAEKRVLVNGRNRLVGMWVIKRSDLEAYRSSKNNSDKRMVDGEKLFDIENDRWGVFHASKVISQMLGRPYRPARVYYLLRMGMMRGKKRGNIWVVSRAEILRVYEMQKKKDEMQMKFA